ncbi:D-alanyl-D-alanine carboxypeptidase/D-alanyl-D-alanine endopeptidase [Nocardioides sp.]|uniref:D-alanyl-D-alanine carboxypeptidase/D-alanyl-D-alanine endopeptidase n=1 Tax=Nocardioides sp. TaxID=35761 RepID=UPI002ED118E6
MGKRDRGHAPRRASWLPVLLVLLLLGGAAAAYLTGVADRWAADETPDPVTEPAAVPPPDGMDLAAVPAPEPVAEAAGPGRLRPAAVRRTLTAALEDRDLGRSVHAAVAALGEGPPAYSTGDAAFTPASTMKVLTATAVLAALGPDHRFDTTVVANGRRLTLVGGGDPMLARRPADDWPRVADVQTLAEETAAAVGRRKPVRLAYDASLFTGPAENPYWRDDYLVDGIVSPISALWVDEGLAADRSERVSDPAADAAAAFAAALAEHGVRVQGTPTPNRAPAAARTVASVSSPPLSQIVEHVILVSDNEGAEVLAHHVGLTVSGDGSFAGGARGVRKTLGELGVPLDGAVIRDGSGLSRKDRLRTSTLIEVLRVAAEQPELRAVLTGLPVGGFTGSLTFRFADAPAAGLGRVRAKTGTLGGVRSLAGIATDQLGTPMVFVLAADRIRVSNSVDAQVDLDNLAGALGACRCSR